MNPVSPSSGSSRSRLVLVLTLLIALFVVTGCGKSGGGSGDKVRLSNPQASISANAALIDACQLDGFPNAWIIIADYNGDKGSDLIGGRGFYTLTFLPSGASDFGSFTFTGEPNPFDIVIGPEQVGGIGCYQAGGATRIRIDFYVITNDDRRSNTVSDTFNT